MGNNMDSSRGVLSRTMDKFKTDVLEFALVIGLTKRDTEIKRQSRNATRSTWMVKICYEGAQRSKQERPGEDVVGNSRGTAWIKEPQAFAKINLCNDSTVASEPKVRLKRRKEEVGCVEDKQRMDAVKEKAIEAIMRYCDSLYFKENTIEEKLNGIQGPRTQGRGKYRSEGYTSDESDGTDNKPRRNGDKSQINCYKCGKLGQYAYECPSKKKEEVEALLVENDDEPALLMCLIENSKYEDGQAWSSVTDQIENGVMPKMKTNKWALARLKKTNREG
ncbi:zinc finger, CCHC-type containing protein [Tanacetum coccineum]